MSALRVLHVGTGFRPWRRGGLVAYVEDLMDEQVKLGHQVAYFFSGRQYPMAGAPHVRRWPDADIAKFEVINSPLYDHGRQPELELSEPRVEQLFAQTLREVRPDVCHVQELAGLPSSLLEISRATGVPTVMTLQDYFPLCPTFKLFDAGGQVCLRQEVGGDCQLNIQADERPSGLLIESTVAFTLARGLERRGLDGPRALRWTRPVARAAGRMEARRRRPSAAIASADAFQRRRVVNLERLNRVNLLVGMSRRLSDIYAVLGVDESRLRTIHLTLRHIEQLNPRRASVTQPLTFGTLAGFESVAKGGPALVETMRALSPLAAAGRLRLLVFGHVTRSIRAEAEGIPGVEVRGRYRPDELDRLLDEVDVGLMTSVWEEAYGYAGIEFLAKGIPVIANAIGGMTDYVREGETGWLNRSCSPGELAQIMSGLIERPEVVAELSERIAAHRHSILTPHKQHVADLDRIYAEVMN